MKIHTLATPKVSIIIPVYNGANYLRAAIESARAQTYANTEIIVVNDGSTDGGRTEAIACSYGDTLRYISQENAGVGGALNAGIRAMTGNFFTWLSHDDLFFPQKIESNLSYYKQIGHRDAIIFSDYALIDESGTLIYSSSLPFSTYLDSPMLPLLDGAINGNALFIPKSIFLISGLFRSDLRYTQDYDLWNRILNNFEFFHQPKPLVMHRIHPGQDSQRSEILPEGNSLWTSIIETRSEIERVQLHGSARRFYGAMRAFLDKTLYAAAAAQAARLEQGAIDAASLSILLFVRDDVDRAVASAKGILSENYGDLEIVIGPLSRLEVGAAVAECCPPGAPISVMAGPLLASIRNGLPLVCAARGDYIGFMLPEGVYQPRALRRHVEALQNSGRTISRSTACEVDHSHGRAAEHLDVTQIVIHRSLQRFAAMIIKDELFRFSIQDLMTLSGVDEIVSVMSAS